MSLWCQIASDPTSQTLSTRPRLQGKNFRQNLQLSPLKIFEDINGLAAPF